MHAARRAHCAPRAGWGQVVGNRAWTQEYSGMGEYKLLLKDFPSFNSQQIFSLKKIPLFGFFSPKSLGNLCKSPWNQTGSKNFSGFVCHWRQNEISRNRHLVWKQLSVWNRAGWSCAAWLSRHAWQHELGPASCCRLQIACEELQPSGQTQACMCWQKKKCMETCMHPLGGKCLAILSPIFKEIKVIPYSSWREMLVQTSEA